MREHLWETSAEDFMRGVLNGAFAILFVIFFIKAYVYGAHLNWIDKSRQFYSIPTAYAFMKK